ncbi:hypothetical protein CYMTET_34900 [Cymbomonas tetramitiformis]|uniref:Uncharacterized protein n=1 Tax=Cymbomonas tetramitiformis TaxID=36881 RepID=A0AAE0FAD0_9CHLO|nr:hypothetical protein CYMTET_34900 [Cymbomonas tetramitiformis]
MSTVYSRVAGHGSLLIGHMLKTGTSIAPSHAATINVPLSGLLVALQNAAVAAVRVCGSDAAVVVRLYTTRACTAPSGTFTYAHWYPCTVGAGLVVGVRVVAKTAVEVRVVGARWGGGAAPVVAAEGGLRRGGRGGEG